MIINIKPLELPTRKVTNPISIHRLSRIIFQLICSYILQSLKNTMKSRFDTTRTKWTCKISN